MRWIKIIRLALHINTGLILTIFQLGIKRLEADHPVYLGNVQWWFEKLCRLLNIDIVEHGKPLDAVSLLAANHISWLDIPVLGSVVNPSFLSKDEVRRWPVIGWLAEKAGTLFIRRGNREAADDAKTDMLRRLKGQDGTAARHVLFFPEGTTSDGTRIKPFKGRLFKAAIEANIPVQPILLVFPDEEHGFNTAIPFTGNQNLIVNVLNIMKRNYHRADVYWLEPITDLQHYTPRELARKCEALLQERFSRLSPAKP